MARPDFLERTDPTLIYPERMGKDRQRVNRLSSFFAGVDQSGFTQRVQMLHHAKAREVRERVHNLRRGTRSVAQQIENGAPRGIRQRFPHRVQLSLGPEASWHVVTRVLFYSASMWFHPMLTPLRWFGSIMFRARRCRNVTWLRRPFYQP